MRLSTINSTDKPDTRVADTVKKSKHFMARKICSSFSQFVVLDLYTVIQLRHSFLNFFNFFLYQALLV